MKPFHLAKQWLVLLLLLLSTAAHAQTGTVSGRITDEKKLGVPGATVLIEGTTIGTAANSDGTYLIANVPAGPQTVAISFIGFATLRRSVTVVIGQTVEVSVSLSESATQLSEAVVVGYGTQRRQDVTGAIATVDSRQFVKGQITTPEQLIQGKVAGVSVTTNSGQPGAGSQIRIRGLTSVSSSSDPLIVIDGVPVSNDRVSGAPSALSLINPNDIESFSVLKDASATAIYGSRAAAGVILITTKKGVAGDKLHVNFSSQFSIATVANRLKVLNGDEYRALLKSQGYRSATGDTVTGFPPVRRDTLLGTANTDWQKEVYRTAYTFDNNISLTGSVGKTPFRVSYGNLNQQGIIKTSELQRNTLSVGLTPVVLKDLLRIDVNLKGSVSKNRFTDGAVVFNALAFDPTRPVSSTDPRYAPYGGYYETLQRSPTALGNYQQEGQALANPVSLLNSRDDRSTVQRSIGNVRFDLKIPGVRGLRANYNVGYDFQYGQGTVLIAPKSRVGVLSVDNDTTKGGISRYSQNVNSWLNEAYLNYTHDFEKLGRLDVVVGYSYQNFYTRSPNNLGTYANGRSLPETSRAPTPYTSAEHALQSYYARLNYSFKNRYLLTATLRQDQSSRFAPSNRTGNFPALGLGWRLKEESFLKDVSFLSELKLRAGYGVTGQQDIGGTNVDANYGYLPRFLVGSTNVAYQFGYNANGTSAFQTTLRPQSVILSRKWENTQTYNAGLDYGLGASGRVTGTVDVYYKKSYDLLLFAPIAAGAGLTNLDTYNVGAFENRGIEFAINAEVLRTEKLAWTLNFNASYIKSKVLNTTRSGGTAADTTSTPLTYGGAGFNNLQVVAPGYPVGSFFLFKQKYDEKGNPITANLSDHGGINAFEDINHDGRITAADQVVGRQPSPKFILGMTSNLRAGNAFLNFTLRSYLGNYVYNNVSQGLNTYAGLFNSAGNNFSNTSALLGNEINFTTYQPLSDYYVQKADFVRCDNVTVGYNFPKLGGNESRTMGVSLSVQNAFVITPYKGIDPEVGNGVDSNAYPRARTYTVGLNLGF